MYTAMRHSLLSGGAASTDGAHPPLLDRIGWMQSYSTRGTSAGEMVPAATVLGDLEAMEQMLHNRVFAVAKVEPSVFHRSRSG
jgi:hypothetical protein